MSLDTAALRLAAEAATPGPWHLSADGETITGSPQ